MIEAVLLYAVVQCRPTIEIDHTGGITVEVSGGAHEQFDLPYSGVDYITLTDTWRTNRTITQSTQPYEISISGSDATLKRSTISCVPLEGYGGGVFLPFIPLKRNRKK